MEKKNSIFEENYKRYLRQLEDVDLSLCEKVLGIGVDKERKTAEIPFFKTTYRVSQAGVTEECGKRPDYGTCVVLLKYLLMCPQRVPTETDWVTYRDFKDAGQSQNTGLSAYAAQAVSKHYAGNLDRLRSAVDALGGRPPDTDYPYDVSAVFDVLPRLPVLFLFNDMEEQFPAKTSILYERRASSFLDAECRVMVDWYLLENLKRVEKDIITDKPVF